MFRRVITCSLSSLQRVVVVLQSYGLRGRLRCLRSDSFRLYIHFFRLCEALGIYSVVNGVATFPFSTSARANSNLRAGRWQYPSTVARAWNLWRSLLPDGHEDDHRIVPIDVLTLHPLNYPSSRPSINISALLSS